MMDSRHSEDVFLSTGMESSSARMSYSVHQHTYEINSHRISSDLLLQSSMMTVKYTDAHDRVMLANLVEIQDFLAHFI